MGPGRRLRSPVIVGAPLDGVNGDWPAATGLPGHLCSLMPPACRAEIHVGHLDRAGRKPLFPFFLRLAAAGRRRPSGGKTGASKDIAFLVGQRETPSGKPRASSAKQPTLILAFGR